MPDEQKTNGWQEYQKLVLHELKSNTKAISDVSDDVGVVANSLNDLKVEVKVEIGKLKVKAGVWGLLGGLIPVAIALMLSLYLQ